MNLDMNMKLDRTTMILIGVLLFVAAFGYWYFFTGDDADSATLTAVPSGNAAQSRFESLVGQLGPINFDTKIFSDPRFNSLVDLKTPISAETAGRADPFAPVSGVTGQ